MLNSKNSQAGLVKNIFSAVDKALTNLVHGDEDLLNEENQFIQTKLPEQVKSKKIGNTDDLPSDNSFEKGSKNAIPPPPPTIIKPNTLPSMEEKSDFQLFEKDFDDNLTQNKPSSISVPKSLSKPVPVQTPENPKPKNDNNSKPKPEKSESSHGGGWLHGIFSKLNPFNNSTNVDLSLHDEGEMVWNGHKYVFKGHENDEEESAPPPPPPPKTSIPPTNSISPDNTPSPEPSQPVSGPPPSTNSGPPPPVQNTPPRAGRTRAVSRYVAKF